MLLETDRASSLPFVLLLAALAAVADARCYLDNSTGLPLPRYYDPITGNVSCKPGFFCPGLIPGNASTYPVACPAFPDCAVKRLQGSACDFSMGTYEPQVCSVGYYCPPGETTRMLKCPSSAYCHYGTVYPQPCRSLAFCIGTDKVFFYGGLIIWCAASTLLVIGVLLYQRWGLLSTLTASVPSVVALPPPVSHLPTDPEEKPEASVAGREVFDQLLVEGFQRAREDLAPLRFEFNHLQVSVVDRASGAQKMLLRDCSGALEPGTVTAIMGPSGCGKTTFMMALLGKGDPAWTTAGTLTVNGEPMSRRFTHAIGFVPQDDVLHTDLSGYKNIYYSSETRLPSNWTSEQRAVFRTAVIGALGLEEQRDVLIGDEHTRGVSGGQRKRVSIGVELAAAPLALFLDEPTSGLDSTTSLSVCESLTCIAAETRLTVAMVIHQPRREIWTALDHVLFLGDGGRVVFQGRQVDAQPYFEQECGIAFPLSSNPADVIIDAIALKSDELATRWERRAQGPPRAVAGFVGEQGEVGAEEPAGGATDRPETAGKLGRFEFRGASFWKQLLLSHNRSIEKQLAGLGALRLELLTAVLCGLILGSTYLQYQFSGMYVAPYERLSPIAQTDLPPQLFMYNAMSVGLFAAPAGVRTFSLDRMNYFRQAAAGYGALPYFIGSVLSNFYRVVYVSLLFASAYVMMGGMAISFWGWWASMALLMWCTYCLAFIVSMLVSRRMAPLVAQVGSVCVAAFNGYISYPVWLKQITFSFHSSQILANLWYKTTDHVFQPQFEEWDYSEGTVGQSIGVLIAISVVLQIIAFLCMIGVDRNRQR